MEEYDDILRCIPNSFKDLDINKLSEDNNLREKLASILQSPFSIKLDDAVVPMEEGTYTKSIDLDSIKLVFRVSDLAFLNFSPMGVKLKLLRYKVSKNSNQSIGRAHRLNLEHKRVMGSLEGFSRMMLGVVTLYEAAVDV